VRVVLSNAPIFHELKITLLEYPVFAELRKTDTAERADKILP